MSQAGYTPIQLYYSTTAAAVPVNTNLANGELAINITDGKLYYKDNTGTVKVIAGAGGAGVAGGSTTQVQYNSSGSLAGSANMTFDGTILTAAGFAGPHNGTVGATTPTTGAFTTIRSSTGASSAIFGGGSSSNEVVTITAQTGGLGIGLGIQNSSSNLSGISFPTNASATTAYTYITADGRSGASGFIKSYVNDTVISTLTSTGLGIGTTSFTAKLTAKTAANTYTGGALALVSSTSTSTYLTNIGGALYVSNDGSTDHLVLSSAGNLGLGVTPSAWGSSRSAIDMGANAYVGGTALSHLTNNVYFNGTNFIYKTTAATGMYQIAGAAHQWYSAASGTAGNIFTFTQAMTLGSTGDLILGGTDTSVGKMVVRYTSVGTNPLGPVNAGLNLWGDSSVRLLFGTYTSGSYAAYIQASNTGTGFPIALNPSGGFVGIGTNSPTAKLQLDGTTDASQRIIVGGTGNVSSYKLNYNGSEVGFIQNYQNTEMSIGTTVAASLGFNTNNTQRFVITSAGALGIGATPSYGTSGQVLTSGGSGAAPTWTTVSGGGGSPATPLAQGTVYGSMTSGSGSPYLTALGYLAAYTNTGAGNVAVGYAALYVNTSGIDNTSVGMQSMLNSTTGNSNVAVGKQALQGNTTGSGNVAIGFEAGKANTTASNSVYIGYQAGLSNTAGSNVGIGYNVLGASSSSASGHVAIGQNVLYSLTTGTQNIALGNNAQRFITTGTWNVSIGGTDSMLNATTASYNTAVGISSGGNVSTGSGNIIIGGRNSGGSYSPVFAVGTEGDRVVMGTSSVSNAYIQVAWTVVSDARDKTNFAPVPHGLDFVNQLNPVQFQFKASRTNDAPHGPVRYGFKAQEILELEGANPVVIDADVPEKLKYIDQHMTAILVKAIQELTAQVETLKSEIAILKGA